jgi:hypothetical protein
MNNRCVLPTGFSEDGRVNSHDSNSSREAEKIDGLRRGQILSVRRACDKFLESRGLKQLPFGTFVLRKSRKKNDDAQG